MTRYKVVFLGLALASPEEEIRLLKGLQKKFNLTPEKAEALLQRVPIVIKKGASREETEKYVRAFDEIGGKVRVEEESEILEIQPEPAPGNEPERKGQQRTMTCPQCGLEQAEADQCARCGTFASRRLQEQGGAYEERTTEASYGTRTVRWEEADGFISAFLGTTRDLLFSPVRFYKRASAGRGYWSPFIYAMISGIIGMGASILWQWFFFSQWFPIQRISALPSSLYFIALTVLLPLMSAFFLAIGTAVTHFCVMIVGGNRRGFQATFRSISYAFGGSLFGIIPFIGSTIGWIYSIVLAIIGVKEGHEISTARAVLGVLLPILVVIVLTLAAILLPILIGVGKIPFGRTI